ncbi:hypothetical protein U728_922 [Clostridium botulinum 202F]|nr:hypothetical protein U728_922 [Clostridium botulinum 202F]KAI3346086.1 hypothetical protein CIT17_10945 [Clostridium botulinum]KON13357.1 hypothetical protein ACP50_04550 [Clostridium botulinum]MBY6987712.1 hypothetical protein [Clostridium botulinum]NFH01639.1 hypothetical protein [Clostridium botulinum]
MFKNIFKRESIEIIHVKTIINKPCSWGGNGIIFYVKNGKGLLAEKYGNYEKDALATLVYDNVPLVKFHADEYFCPTCEKLVSAGYGLNMAADNIIEKMHETLNAPFISLEDSFDNIKPILGLLQTGYYALVDTELYPSNGNGEFFWKTSNLPELNKASCPIYGGDGLWSEPIPKYIIPTQPPTRFNRNQAEFYRKNDNYRAIAYYLEGYLCGLIDGHHKAVASAIDKKSLKSLVIIPTTSATYSNKNINGHKGGISLNGVYLTEDEMITPLQEVIELFKLKRISKSKTAEYLSKNNKDFETYKWDNDILSTEENFPDPFTLARIEWAGDISDGRLDNIINNKEALSSKDALNITLALFISKNPRFKQLAFYFCRIESWSDVFVEIFTLLTKIDNTEVEDFFIEYLVNYDYNYPCPEVKKIVDDYFAVYGTK